MGNKDNKIKIAASILNSNFANLAGEIEKVEKAGIDMLHIDVMDAKKTQIWNSDKQVQ